MSRNETPTNACTEFIAPGWAGAGSFGAGFRIHVTGNLGVLFEVRGFDGPDMPAMARPSVGVFYRFR